MADLFTDSLLHLELFMVFTQVEPGVEVKVEKPQGASPYPKRNKRPRSWYSPGKRPFLDQVIL